MDFPPTPEQQAIIGAARSTDDNLIVKALAGAAKTTTLVLIARALSQTPMLCLAFNKRIAEDMKARLPGNCEPMTLNSLGHRVWGKALNKGLRVDAKKNYGILSALVNALPKREKDAAYSSFADILKAIELGKSSGYLPSGKYGQIARGLLGDDDFFGLLEEEPTALEERLIREATIISIDQALKGTIDFSDQIFMPTIFQMAAFPQYPCVLVDEAQDLSPLNHATLRKLVRKRLIAVGDECQSIYGFRGAHEDSMNVLQQSFGMSPLILSISFRCPQAVVAEARWRAPHMQWPEWAKPGTVNSMSQWGADDLPNTATILCRNNAPIFAQAIALLKAGRYPQIVGNDLGVGLMKTLKKLGPASMQREQVLDAIGGWEAEKLKKARNERKVQDQADCLRIFVNQGDSLAEALAYCEHVMTAKGPIQMLTVHKAKGLEFDDVFILDKQLIRMDEEQDRNLLYVAQTRAKESLTYVTSEGWCA